jgi:hypothetical protein
MPFIRLLIAYGPADHALSECAVSQKAVEAEKRLHDGKGKAVVRTRTVDWDVPEKLKRSAHGPLLESWESSKQFIASSWRGKPCKPMRVSNTKYGTPFFPCKVAYNFRQGRENPIGLDAFKMVLHPREL